MTNFKLNLENAYESDRNIHAHMQAGVYYEPDVTNFFVKALKPGDVVVDIGANIGWFTCLAASIVGNTGKVHAFEADVKNAEKLQANVGLNGFTNVVVCQGALSDEVKKAEFFINQDGNGGHALRQISKNPSETVSVITQPLDKVLDVRPTLIKIDTEGHEERILRGAWDILVRPAKPPFVVVELNLPGLKHFGDSEKTMREFMSQFGYDTFLLSYDGELPTYVPPGTEITSNWIQNILFSTIEDVAKLWPVYNPGKGVRFKELEKKSFGI